MQVEPPETRRMMFPTFTVTILFRARLSNAGRTRRAVLPTSNQQTMMATWLLNESVIVRA